MYTLTVKPYLDQYNKQYKQIICINTIPKGNLSAHVKQVSLPKLSPFKDNTPCCSYQKCTYVICDLEDSSKFMCINDIPSLFTFLYENNYTINNELTKMMSDSEIRLANKVLCFFSYSEN